MCSETDTRAFRLAGRGNGREFAPQRMAHASSVRHSRCNRRHQARRGFYQVSRRPTRIWLFSIGAELIQGGERRRLAMPVPLRADFDAEMVRAAAERSKDGPLARRAEFFPCQVELIPLLWADEFPCSGGNHCRPGGERGFSAVSLRRGFRMRRGERRSAMPSQFENLMIFPFENIEVCYDVFSRSERLRMLIGGEW